MVVEPASNRGVFEFLHETGAAASIISPFDDQTWEARGYGVVYIGCSVGRVNTIFGEAGLKGLFSGR
jgi:predicted xylose isomerase-like sugar epimerase